MSPLNRKIIFNVPNIMTLSRIGVIPIIMVLLMIQGVEHSFEFNRFFSYLAAFFFIVAAIFDLVDGYYARKYGMVSLIGRFIDPMADKLIHMAAMILLIPMGRFPAWLTVILLFREIFITGLRSVAAGEGIIISAGDLGKKKTAWFNVGLSGLILYYPIFGVSVYSAGWVCLVIGAVYSILSGIQYVIYFFREVKRMEQNVSNSS